MKSKNYEQALERFRKILSEPETAQKLTEREQVRDEVISRYQSIFSPKNISKLQEDDFRSFLYFENNRHWSSLYRHVTTLTADMDNLRDSISILLDSGRPLATRYDEALGRVKGFGKALATAILLVSSPDKYGIWNNVSENALKQMNLWHDFVRGRSAGQQYEQINKLLLQLSGDLNIDLWALDDLMWRILPDVEDEIGSDSKPVPVAESVTNSFLNEIHHKELKSRLERLTSAPLDTVMREAGVVFEHYIRRKVNPESSNHGVDLIEEALKPGGSLVFSSHVGEQTGVHLLYRGAMMFIRNPPMHKIIDYPESMAQQFLRLIDALMILLDHAAMAGEVTVDDIRAMLTRRPLRSNQIALFQLLYKTGANGIEGKKLAEAMKLTPQQMSGVLGSLGVRINSTEGLEDKGGILLVIDITEGTDGEWTYAMRPILRKALEEEGVLRK